MSRKDTLARAGVIKISYKVVIPCPSGDTVFGNTGLLENKQEWHMMSEAYHKDPCAGYRGGVPHHPQGRNRGGTAHGEPSRAVDALKD